MTVTAPATGPEDLNRLRIGAIAAARPVGTADPRVLAARAWDIDGLAAGYVRWLAYAREIVAAPPGAGDEAVFAMRSELVHEWLG